MQALVYMVQLPVYYYSRATCSTNCEPSVTIIQYNVDVSIYFLNSKFEPIKIKITGFNTVTVLVLVHMVQKYRYQDITYISLQGGQICNLEVWNTSIWGVLGIQHLHLRFRSVIFVITDTFSRALWNLASTGTATGNVHMDMK